MKQSWRTTNPEFHLFLFASFHCYQIAMSQDRTARVSSGICFGPFKSLWSVVSLLFHNPNSFLLWRTASGRKTGSQVWTSRWQCPTQVCRLPI